MGTPVGGAKEATTSPSSSPRTMLVIPWMFLSAVTWMSAMNCFRGIFFGALLPTARLDQGEEQSGKCILEERGINLRDCCERGGAYGSDMVST